MTEPTTGPRNGDGLGRWLVGGLAAGAIVLALLIAAYAIGYHRGERHARTAAPPAATAPATTQTQPSSTTSPPATTATTVPPATGAVPTTPALVARGMTLYSSDGCSACHSLDGSPGVGPSFKGLAGSAVKLANGQTVVADDAYLARSIRDPDAQIVAGYRSGVMPAAIAPYDLAAKPADIRALVAFIDAHK